MRLLHTSDWHLGGLMRRRSLEEEQERFLEWLVERLEREAIDVLVVAGDVFHYPNPSNAARQMYYNFLVDCAAIDGLRKVVIVGGNHDSPSGLDAPRELLDRLDVHVVGGLPRDVEARDRCLVPIDNDAGEVEMVVVAVPYVQEARLGVTLRGAESEAELQQRYTSAFTELYADLAERAESRWPSASLVATGHLTCYGDSAERQEGDYHTELHRSGMPNEQQGGLSSMSPDIFDERYAYVALGHIHRFFPPAGSDRVWYAGTPVATSVDERTKRYVQRVDVEAGEIRDKENIVVPCWRKVEHFEGDEEEVRDALRELACDKPLPPYVFLEVALEAEDDVHAPLEGFGELLEEEFEDDERPIIVDYRYRRKHVGGDEDDEDDIPNLEDMTPVDVFRELYAHEHGGESDPPDELIHTFKELVGQMRDTEEEGR